MTRVVRDDIDGEFVRLFAYPGMMPMGVVKLREYFAAEWHLMGNASLLKFNGVMDCLSLHEESPARHRMLNSIADDVVK